MSTDTNTPNPAPSTPSTPKDPARGNQQGQTTLAAKIDRWEGMINNLQPLLDEVPQLKPAHAQLQQTVADAKVLRDQLRSMKAVVKSGSSQRKSLMSTGEELFSRLSLGLRSAYGPKSERLAAFAVKPQKTGRPSLLPETLPPVTEATTAPATAPEKE
jgi:ABC-type transporter Mla subunit MlaD